jgi:hypothetical protein
MFPDIKSNAQREMTLLFFQVSGNKGPEYPNARIYILNEDFPMI